MNKKIFNPQEWLHPVPNRSTAVASSTPSDDIETITTRIETASVDIAPTYAQWRDLGFALSDQLGAEAIITASAVSILIILRKRLTPNTTAASTPTALAFP